jgi:hypothetical protein
MRLRAFFVSLVLAVAVPVAACSPLAEAQTAGEDSAVGNVVTVPFRPVEFVFDARSGPSGQNVNGSVHWIDRAEFFGGPVTCLTVTGSRATIGFENNGTASDLVKGGFLLVEDNGTPGVGRDNVHGTFVTDPPTVCPPNTFVFRPEFDLVTSGELSVHDAPAIPTSKNQCKTGGWRNFLGFKNEGGCVSFVATHGKNPPTGP